MAERSPQRPGVPRHEIVGQALDVLVRMLAGRPAGLSPTEDSPGRGTDILSVLCQPEIAEKHANDVGDKLETSVPALVDLRNLGYFRFVPAHAAEGIRDFVPADERDVDTPLFALGAAISLALTLGQIARTVEKPEW